MSYKDYNKYSFRDKISLMIQKIDDLIQAIEEK